MNIKRFLSYFMVGGLATIVEWVCFWIFRNWFDIQYLAATVMAIVISTFSNWLFGRLITFRSAFTSFRRVILEIFQVYLASIVGLLLNLGIMWLLHGQLHMADMLSKMIATATVFLYRLIA